MQIAAASDFRAPDPSSDPGPIGWCVVLWQAGWLCTLGALLVLGIPYRVLDMEIGRTMLHSRFRRACFRLFVLPYLLLVGLMLLAWRDASEVTERLLAVTLQLLAVLTLPHMLLDAWLERRAAQWAQSFFRPARTGLPA